MNQATTLEHRCDALEHFLDTLEVDPASVEVETDLLSSASKKLGLKVILDPDQGVVLGRGHTTKLDMLLMVQDLVEKYHLLVFENLTLRPEIVEYRESRSDHFPEGNITAEEDAVGVRALEKSPRDRYGDVLLEDLCLGWHDDETRMTGLYSPEGHRRVHPTWATQYRERNSHFGDKQAVLSDIHRVPENRRYSVDWMGDAPKFALLSNTGQISHAAAGAREGLMVFPMGGKK